MFSLFLSATCSIYKSVEHLQEHDTYNEPELLKRIAEGSETAFRQLFMTYRRRVFSYLFKVTGSREIAEDQLQEVFLKLWSMRARLPDITNINAYLHSMAHSQAYHGLKYAAREMLVKDRLREEESHSNDPGSKLLSEEVQKYIQRLVDQLTPAQRKVFLLSREQGLVPKEIAEQLQLTPNTVRKHLRDALTYLREEIGRTYGTQAIALYVLFELGLP